MALLNTVPLDKAEGAVKEGYEIFLKNGAKLFKPFEHFFWTAIFLRWKLR